MQEIVMTDPRKTGSDDADIDLDTQELVKPTSEEPRTGASNADIERRVRDTEAAVAGLRATVTGLERELAIVRADLERLRQESERAAGSKMP